MEIYSICWRRTKKMGLMGTPNIHSSGRLSLDAIRTIICPQCNPASNERDNWASDFPASGTLREIRRGCGKLCNHALTVLGACVCVFLVKLKRIKVEINIVVKPKWWVHWALAIAVSHLLFPLFLFSSIYMPLKGERLCLRARAWNMCFRSHKNHLYYLSCVWIHP